MTADDPAAATVKPGPEEIDAYVTPSGIGTVGVNVAWTESSDTETDANGDFLVCRIQQHLSLLAVAGSRLPVAVLGERTGDFERNRVGAGLSPRGCTGAPGSAQPWLIKPEPVQWTLHWTTNGRAPSQSSKALTWKSADPCNDQRPGPITGPRRVSNSVFVANRYAYTRAGAAVILNPAFRSRGMRGWWQIRVGGQPVRSTRFRWVHGTGIRRFPGGSAPITGVRLEHDSGPCPGLGCSPWTRFAGI